MNQQVREIIETHIALDQRAGYEAALAAHNKQRELLLPLDGQRIDPPSDKAELLVLGREYEQQYYRMAQSWITLVYWEDVLIGMLHDQLTLEIEQHLEPNQEDADAVKQLQRLYERRELTREEFMRDAANLSKRMNVRIATVKDKRQLLGRIRILRKGLQTFRPPGAVANGQLASVRIENLGPVQLLGVVHDMASASAARVWDEVIGPLLLESPA